MAPAILLDTCAAIWIATGAKIRPEALESLAASRAAGHTIQVSPMTAWEIGRLTASGRITLTQTPLSWFRSLTTLPGVALAELAPDVLIESSFLPGAPPRDPIDRIMIATARFHGLSLMTRDKAILAFAEKGHLQAIAC